MSDAIGEVRRAQSLAANDRRVAQERIAAERIRLGNATLSTRAYNILTQAFGGRGFDRPMVASCFSRRDLLLWPYCAKVTTDEIGYWLGEGGYAFQNDMPLIDKDARAARRVAAQPDEESIRNGHAADCLICKPALGRSKVIREFSFAYEP